MSPEPITTAEQLFSANLQHCELIEGKVVMGSPAGFDEGRLAARIAAALENHVAPRKLGVVTTAKAGFQLAHDPDTVRAPDVAFVRTESIPPGGVMGFFHGAPDLAVEILSHADHAGGVAAKVRDWLQAGCLMVWVVDPENHTIAVHRSPADMAVFGPGDMLAIDDLLPEFSLPVSNVFA